VSIVSDKAQTTRRRVLGVSTRPDWQIVWVDTPGLHQGRGRLGKALNEAARGSLGGCDAVLVLVDVSRMPSKEDKALAQTLEKSGWLAPGLPLVLGLNKMDLLKPVDVEAHYETYKALFRTERALMTSLSKLQNVDKLIDACLALMPVGPPLYDEDTFTDQSSRTIAAELVREKALRLTRQEVPHAIATMCESWEEDDRLVRIGVVVLVETEGQKAIVIGRGGQMLKTIGTEARTEIEELLGKKVFLELFVKVRNDWRENTGLLKELEYL
jgi:GTPase